MKLNSGKGAVTSKSQSVTKVEQVYEESKSYNLLHVHMYILHGRQEPSSHSHYKQAEIVQRGGDKALCLCTSCPPPKALLNLLQMHSNLKMDLGVFYDSPTFSFSKRYENSMGDPRKRL